MRQSTAIAVTPGRPSSLRRVTIDVPPPNETEVLIDVIRCGVCGTDREVIAGHLGNPPDNAEFLVLGHEMLGRVREIGRDGTGFAVGDLVSATVRRPDGCPLCEAGQPDMCLWDGYTEHGIERLHGFLSQQVVVDQRWIVRLPETLESTGVFVEPLTVVEKVIRQATHVQQRLAIWEPRVAMILGAGPIGILATLALRSMGLDVVTVARTPAPNSAARVIQQSGAQYISTREEDLDAVRHRMPPIDIVIESTGAAAMSHQAISMVGKNGVVALLSITGDSGDISVPADALNHSLVYRNGIVIGSVNAGMEDWDAAVQRLGHMEQLWPGLVQSMITTRIPLDGDITTINRPPEDDIKTVVEFQSR